MSESAVEKSAALVTSMSHEMDQACPVCRGGWWYEEAEIVYAVHASGCPWQDKGEREIWALAGEQP